MLKGMNNMYVLSCNYFKSKLANKIVLMRMVRIRIQVTLIVARNI